MATSKKRAIFNLYRKSLAFAHLTTTSEDSLICPLCWQEIHYASLTLEHIVPGSIGGKREILTCGRCNNEQGSALDSHLSQFQSIKGRFDGKGKLRGILLVNGHKVSANIEWGKGHKNIEIIGEASNPAEVSAIQNEIEAGNVSELEITLPFGYSKNRFQTAVLRAVYLVAFKWFAYKWANHEIVQIIRRRICDPSLGHPRLSSLIVGVGNFEPPRDMPHFLAQGNWNGVGFYLVIIRVRKETTTYVGAYLPIPDDRSSEFFGVMEQNAHEHDGRKFSIAASDLIM